MPRKKTEVKPIITEKVEIFVFLETNEKAFALNGYEANLKYETSKKAFLDLLMPDDSAFVSLTKTESFAYQSEIHSGKHEFLKKISAKNYLETVDEEIQKKLIGLYRVSQLADDFENALIVFKRTTIVKENKDAKPSKSSTHAESFKSNRHRRGKRTGHPYHFG